MSQSEPPCKVLVVEDHADTAAMSSRMVRLVGFDVAVAADFRSAAAAAKAARYDVLLCDIRDSAETSPDPTTSPGDVGGEVEQHVFADPVPEQAGRARRCRCAGWRHRRSVSRPPRSASSESFAGR